MAQKRKKTAKTRAPAAGGAQPPKAAAVEKFVAHVSQEEHREGSPSLTPYELERQRIIQRNRERLLALGIPSLVASLQPPKAGAAAPPNAKRRKKDKIAAEVQASAAGKGEDGFPAAQPLRRSARVQHAQQSPEELLEFELGQFLVEGRCPRCGEEVGGGREQHQAHLEGCSGRELPKREKGAAPARRDVEMSAEERKDLRKRTLARMKQLSLENLVDLSEDGAKFVVLGSTGNHYTVTLSSQQQSCQCMDYRFRRHHCKHICLALSHLGILDDPGKWREAVEAKLDQLVHGGEGGEKGGVGVPPLEVSPPLGKEAKVALNLL